LSSTASLPSRLANVNPKKLATGFQDLARRNLFSGQVLVRTQEHELFFGAFGLESREYAVANTRATRLNMGSMGKMLTAALIGKLHDMNKLQFTDTVDQHLGNDWLAPDSAKRITIAMLLSQTSGLGDYLDAILPYSQEQFRDLDGLKSYIRATKPEADPGTKWIYSNTGFEVLGAIAEAASGLPYWRSLKSMVLTPARMTATGRYLPTEVEPQIAQSYSVAPKEPSKLGRPLLRRFDIAVMAEAIYRRAVEIESQGYTISNTTSLLPASSAGGGSYTTADDMVRFFDAFDSGKIVSRQTRTLMLAPQPLSDSYRYGFGLMDPAGEGYGHNGGAPGVSALAVEYKDGSRLVLLANIDRGTEVAYATLLHAASKA
jgi:CubicO group peptidase (beta-lactamase class C family)